MLLPLILAFSASPAHAEDGGLAAAWGVDTAPTRWVFVFETTLSGKKSAEAAREPIARLVEALPAGDSVQIIAMHTRSSPALPPRVIDDAGRAALAAEIRALQIPSAKSMDLGAGLSELASTLDVADAGAAQIVMTGTFCHTPPLGSVWADGGFGCRAVRSFEKLEQAYDAGSGRDRVGVTLFPVATPEQVVHQQGVDEVRRFFEPSGFVEIAEEPLPAWLGKLAAGGLADARVRAHARGEATRFAPTLTVTTEPSLESPRAELRVASGLVHLGFDVQAVTVTGATATGEPLTRLAPDGVLALTVDVPKPPFSLVPRVDTVSLPVTVRLDGTLTPAAALTAAGIPPERTGVTAEVTLSATRSYGLSPTRSAGMFLSGLLLVGASGLVVRRRVQPLRLGGTFSYRRSGGPRQTLNVEHLSEAPIIVQPDGTLAVGRREDAVLVLRMERPLYNTRATVEIKVPNAEINTRPVAPGRHAIVAGATSLQFLDYRLSWE